MITSVTTCFSKYATFQGRASLSEYWHFALFMLIGNLVCGLLDLVVFPEMALSPLGAIFNLVTFLPSIAVTTRRLHDIDKSGWWQLINIIPLIGSLIFLVWITSLGRRGSNRFGDNPAPVTMPV